MRRCGYRVRLWAVRCGVPLCLIASWRLAHAPAFATPAEPEPEVSPAAVAAASAEPQHARARPQQPAEPQRNSRAHKASYNTVVTAPKQSAVQRELGANIHALNQRSGFIGLFDARRATEAAPDVSSTLGQAVGVHVRSFGGLGAFSATSIRGASEGQTAIYLDHVPLSRDAISGFDFGDLAFETVDGVEVYRGAIPAEFGGGLGGAVHLISKAPRGKKLTQSAISVGSFGHARGSATVRRQAGGTGVIASLLISRATGDFTYFDDNGTPYNLDDDRTRRRSHNNYSAVEATTRVGIPVGQSERGDELTLAARARYKTQGVPAPGNTPNAGAKLSALRLRYDLSYQLRSEDKKPKLRVTADFGAAREHYWDDSNGVGVGNQDRRYSTLAGGISAWYGVRSAKHEAALWSETRVEWLRDEDLARGGSRGGAERVRFAAAAEERWYPHKRLLVEGALRLDWMRSSPAEGSLPRPVFERESPAARTDHYVSPRAGAKLELAPGLLLKANVGRYVRPPSFLELYGDRGSAAGNKTLVAEQGTAEDVGLVLFGEKLDAAESPKHRWLLEAVLFASQPKDAIVFIPANQVSIAQNLTNAKILGQEFAATFVLWRRVTLLANYTHLDPINQGPPESHDGLRLPGRPEHELFGKTELLFGSTSRRGASITVSYDVAWEAGDMRDTANYSPAPSRLIHGLGTTAEWGSWTFALSVRNVSDQRTATIHPSPPPRPDLTAIPAAISDVLGQPLPGRSLLFTLTWREQ